MINISYSSALYTFLSNMAAMDDEEFQQYLDENWEQDDTYLQGGYCTETDFGTVYISQALADRTVTAYSYYGIHYDEIVIEDIDGETVSLDWLRIEAANKVGTIWYCTMSGPLSSTSGSTGNLPTTTANRANSYSTTLFGGIVDNFYDIFSGGTTYYHVTYSANGGSASVTDNNDYESGDTVTVIFTPTPTKSGYNFVGWSTTVGGTFTPEYHVNGTTSFTISANTTLYACWAKYVYEFFNVDSLQLSSVAAWNGNVDLIDSDLNSSQLSYWLLATDTYSYLNVGAYWQAHQQCDFALVCNGVTQPAEEGVTDGTYTIITANCAQGTRAVINLVFYIAPKTYELKVYSGNTLVSSCNIDIPKVPGNYSVIFTLSNGQTINAGTINVGIYPKTYNLSFTLSDNTTVSVGQIVTPIEVT